MDRTIDIKEGGLDDPRVIQLLEVHVSASCCNTGPGCAHVLNHRQLHSPDTRFWSAWDGEILLGIVALKRLSDSLGEIKSMHIAQAFRRRGVGRMLLLHLIKFAQKEKFGRLSLETGAWDFFKPARALYAKHGFVECEPFGDYQCNPNSVWMTLDLNTPPPPPDAGGAKI